MVTKERFRFWLQHISVKEIFLALSVAFIYLTSASQNTTTSLTNIKSIEQARALIEHNPKAGLKLFTLSSDKDTSDITLPLFSKQAGYTFNFEGYNHKILEVITYPEFRVSYIYLDGSQMAISTIDSLRTIIITKFKTGTPFYDLVKEYTMDGNPNGDLGWFREGMMVRPFEEAIRHRLKGEIFIVDVPDNKWYYVVFKTFDDRKTKQLTIVEYKTK